MNLRSLSDFFQQSLIESILSPIPTTELSVLFVALAYLLLLVSFVIADCALLLRCYPDHCCRFVPPIFHSRCSSIKRVCYICNYLFRFSSWVLLRFFCCHSLFVNWFILVLMKIPCCSVLLSFSACFVSFYRGRYLVLDHDIYAHHLVSTWRWGWEALPWNSALSCNGKRSAFFNVWRRATTPSDCLLNRDMSQQWLTSACWFAATFVFASPLPQCSIDWFFVLKFVVIPFVTVVEFVATMIFCSFQRFIMIYTVVNNSVVHVFYFVVQGAFYCAPCQGQLPSPCWRFILVLSRMVGHISDRLSFAFIKSIEDLCSERISCIPDVLHVHAEFLMLSRPPLNYTSKGCWVLVPTATRLSSCLPVYFCAQW